MEFRINSPLTTPTHVDTIATPRANAPTKKMTKIFFSEMMGTAAFVGLSLSNVAIYALLPSKMAWEGVALAWGFNLLLGIKIAQYGNAYLNPCIALCDFLLSGNINLVEFAVYFLAEMIGAFLGAVLAYSLHYKLYPTEICTFFATSPAPGVTYAQAFFIEFIGTMILSLCIFKIVGSGMRYSEYAIASSLTAIVLSIGYQTAFAYNWARDFGPRLFATAISEKCMNDYTLVPFLADFAGAVVGWILAHI